MTDTQLLQKGNKRLARVAESAGVPKDQIAHFVNAGYVPQPKQLEFHGACREADSPNGPIDIAFGGARGGGKSRAVICQLALDDCQRIPNLKGLFLRKLGKAAKESFEDLRRQALMQVPHNYRTHLGVLEFPNGSRVVLGHFKNENDIDAYLGLEYDVIAIEEDTQLSAHKKRDIKTCLRTSKQNWRPRTYRTTNPGGIDHQGFKATFIEPWRKGTETTTRFIPATVRDNRFVNVEYKSTLESLTGWQRKAWLDGEWDIAAGQYFSTWRHEKHVIDPFVIPKHWPVWAALDYGFTHKTAAYFFTEFDGTIYAIAEHCERKKLPPFHAAHIHGMAERLGRKVDSFEGFYAGHDCFAHHGDAGGRTIAQQYNDLGIELTPANIDRVGGWARILDLLGDPDNGHEPHIKFFSNCMQLIECLPMLQHKPNKPEDVLKVDVDEDGNGGDDPADALRYGVATPRFKQAPVASASMSIFR